jgi:predicted secreted protein
MSKAFAPRATLFQHATNQLGPWTTVAEVVKVQNTGSKADLADVTNFDSPSSFREFLATLVDSGDVAVDCNFIAGNATQQILETDFNNQTLGWYMIVLPNSLGQAQFQAYVSSKDFDFPVEKQATRSIKLKITGPMYVNW